MKMISKYKQMSLLSENAVFEFLISNLKDTIRTYDFFVAWGKDYIVFTFQIEVPILTVVKFTPFNTKSCASKTCRTKDIT